MSLGLKSLTAIIAEVQKTHAGTVFSITPSIKNHRAVAVVLLARKGDDGDAASMSCRIVLYSLASVLHDPRPRLRGKQDCRVLVTAFKMSSHFNPHSGSIGSKTTL